MKKYTVRVSMPIDAQSKDEAIELFMEQLEEMFIQLEKSDLTVEENE